MLLLNVIPKTGVVTKPQLCTRLKLLWVFIFVMNASVYASNDPENGRKQTETESDNVCTTPACLRTSHAILSAIDSTVDPCQDFYQYACGRWPLRNPTTKDLPFSNPMMQLQDIIETELKASLEETNEDGASEAERSARRFYQSCLNFKTTNKEPVLDLLEQIGGWPAILYNIPDYKGSFQKNLQLVHALGGDAFFKWNVHKPQEQSPLPPDQPFIVIQPSGLTLRNKDSYAKFGSTLWFTLVEVGLWLNDRVPSSLMLSRIKQIVELETQIAHIIDSHLSKMADDSFTAEIFTVSDLQKEFPLLNWHEYFNSMFSQVNISIPASQPVAVGSLPLFRNLASLINEILKTENGEVVLQNYLAWNAIRAYIPGTLMKELVGKLSDDEEQWDTCDETINTKMGYAASAMYIRRITRDKTSKPEESKELAKSILKAVKGALKRNLEERDWLDSETRRAVKEKVDTMSDIIGYPEFILNPVELDKYYDGLVLRADEYIQNKVRVKQFMFRKEMTLLKQFKNTAEFSDQVKSSLFVTVNAMYMPSENQMIFPVGILREPIVDVSLPAAINFGALGFIMGHELVHGFDDIGGLFESAGKLRSWSNNAVVQQFQDRAVCLVEQYSNYNIDRRSNYGERTLSENIADNGGVMAAFNAFTEWKNSSRKENNFLLPGLNVTENQLFFLSYAQLWCTSSTAMDYLVHADYPHSPGYYRVLGPLSNMRQFSNSFQCEPGTRMSPTQKCEVW